ncbi:MAG: hypothetical protein GC168_04990 [Candidatus Hydrogenedens sp.]|nr:hypothetical protein [Candidatus Hydrogenedens sp.]
MAETVKSESLFTDSGKKTIKTLNGIEVDLLASPVEVEGDIVLEGDIPESALLIAKKGTLTVRGFVGGSIAGERDIRIEGNVGGGYVMSSRGQIRLERALSGARIIAFRESVSLRAAESPGNIFGWKGISVDEDVLGGLLLGAKVSVGGRLSGGQVHATGPIQVGHLEHTARTSTLVCLRREISCEEFGRPMTPDERKLRRGMGRHSYSANIMEGMRRYAEKNVRDSYVTQLYMLLCTDLDAHAMSSVRGLQAQANLLGELQGIADLMVTSLAGALKLGERGYEDLEGIAESSLASLAAVAEDAVTMSSAFRLTHRTLITSTAEQFSRIAQTIRRQEVNRVMLMKWIQEINARRKECEDMRESLDENLARLVAGLGLDPAVARSVEANPGKVEAMLNTVIAKLRSDPNNPRAVRLRAPLARLLQNTVDRNNKNIVNWSRQMDAATQELNGLRERLVANCSVLFASNEPGTVYLECERADAGVILVADPRDGAKPLETAATQITVNSPVNLPTRYVLHGFDIQRRVAPARDKAAAES